MTTYPTFTSWKLPHDFLQCSHRYPDENASFGSGVDFTETSATSLVILHLRSHSLVLPTCGHLGERRKELIVSNQINQKTHMSKALHTLPTHNHIEVYQVLDTWDRPFPTFFLAAAWWPLSTYIHACIPWIPMCVIETAGYGTSHRYIKIKTYSANYY